MKFNLKVKDPIPIKYLFIQTGWFHIPNQGRKSHYFDGTQKSLCRAYSIHSSDFEKIKQGKIKLFSLEEIMLTWICKSCLKQLNEQWNTIE